MSTGLVKKRQVDGECNCTELRKAVRRISQMYDAVLATTGIRITQRAILAEIRRSQPINVGQLAQALVMDSGALAHTLKPLEREGFIQIQTDQQDRRQRAIVLTRKGGEKVDETDAMWGSSQDAFEFAFGSKETETLRKMLQLLVSDDFLARFEECLILKDTKASQ